MSDVSALRVKDAFKRCTALISVRDVTIRIGQVNERTYEQKSYDVLTALFAHHGVQVVYVDTPLAETMEIVINNQNDSWPPQEVIEILVRYYESGVWIMKDSDIKFLEDKKKFKELPVGSDDAMLFYAAKIAVMDAAHPINYRTCIGWMNNYWARELQTYLFSFAWASNPHKIAYRYVQECLTARESSNE